MVPGTWQYYGNKDRIDITVNKDLILQGLCLCGSENNDYSVTLEIKNDSNNLCLASNSGTFSSKLLQCKSKKYHGFEVLFDSPVNLKKNVKYQIEALISGPTSGNGERGSNTVQCDGVTFTFSSSALGSTNGTSSTLGQFPEFIFSV